MDRIKFCKSCDQDIAYESTFCQHCGASQAEAVIHAGVPPAAPSADEIADAMVGKLAAEKARKRAAVDAHNAKVSQANKEFGRVALAVGAVIILVAVIVLTSNGSDSRGEDPQRRLDYERERAGDEYDALRRGDIPGDSALEKARWLKKQQDAARDRWIEDQSGR